MSGCADSSKTKEIIYDGNLIVHQYEEFQLGERENLVINNDGEIAIEDSFLQGKYISPVISTKDFHELVSSWNGITPNETDIEVLIKVKVQDSWSGWFSYGRWSQKGDRASIKNQSDEIAKMSIDTLEIQDSKAGDKIKYCIKLRRNDENTPSPRVRNIFISLKLQEEIVKVLSSGNDYLVDLDVPERSQMIIPEIGRVICSPTSVSMVLEYYGINIDTEEVAENVLDKGPNIYGNWSYNVAYGGTKCKYSYVARFTSIDDIKEKIARGIPVIASIKTKTKDIITAAPQAYPHGHLIVVRGFTIKDGEEYLIVNDPAGPEPSSVRREYKSSEFEKAWSKVVYILSSDIN